MNTVLRSILERQLEKRSRAPASVAKALGKSPSWFYRILSGERRITIDSLEEIVLEIGLGLDEFFAEYLQEVCSPHLVSKSGYSEDPQLLLRALRGSKDPDLGWIGDFSLDRISPLQPGQTFAIHVTVGRLDDAREFDRQAALIDAEAWIRSLQRRTEYRRLNTEETSHLCTALGVWASIQRALGHQARGVKALELAWYLHGEAPSAPSCGDLLERMSMAISEYGFPVLGTPSMQRALAIAVQHRDEYRVSKALLGLGILAARSGDNELAKSTLHQLLDRPGVDRLRFVGAATFLALAYEQRGQLEAAKAVLDRIESLMDLPHRAQHSVLGCRARVLAQAGELVAAKELFGELLAAARPHLSPLHRGFIALQFAEVLLKLEDVQSLRGLAGQVDTLSAELEDTPLAQSILLSFCAALKRGEALAVESLRSMQVEYSKSAEPG